MSGTTPAKRTARTAAWALLAGLVVGRFLDGLLPVYGVAVVAAGTAFATDWCLRWREGVRQRGITPARRRDRH